jgi:hypothetical protein
LLTIVTEMKDETHLLIRRLGAELNLALGKGQAATGHNWQSGKKNGQ